MTNLASNDNPKFSSPLDAAPELLRPALWTTAPRALWPAALGILVAAILQIFIVPHVGGFAADLIVNSGIAIILAVSLTVVNGFTGQFSIGHAGFMSLGGYAAIAIVYYGSIHFYGGNASHGGSLSWTGGSTNGATALLGSGDLLYVAACLVGAMIAAAVGYVVGLPSLRLRGDYLAIVTLGFGEIVRVLIQGTPAQLDSYTEPAASQVPLHQQIYHLGGALGFSNAPAYTTVFWVWLAVAITLAATIRLKRSSYGRALLSIREDEIAAQAMGVNITRYKVRAFVFSAFFAGLAGGLYAMKVGTINAGELGFQRSFDIIIMVVLGGLGSISGAAVAAIILTLLPELLRDPPSIWPWGILAAAVTASLVWLFADKRRGPLITLLCVCVGWEVMRLSAAAAHVDLSKYRMILYAITLILMMILRPQGLFGVRELWDFWPKLKLQRPAPRGFDVIQKKA